MNLLARHLGRALFLGTFVLVFAMGSCKGFKGYCQDKMDCVNGNDADVDACVVQAESEQDRASLYGCSKWFNALRDCVETESDCDNDVYTYKDYCQDEERDYGSCMSD
jgi:hypothetical protein